MVLTCTHKSKIWQPKELNLSISILIKDLLQPKSKIQTSKLGMRKYSWKFKDHPINHAHPPHPCLNAIQLPPIHVSYPNPLIQSIPNHLTSLILPLPLTREIHLIPYPCLCIIPHPHTPPIQYVYLHPHPHLHTNTHLFTTPSSPPVPIQNLYTIVLKALILIPQSIIPILHLILNLHIILILQNPHHPHPSSPLSIILSKKY